MSYEPLITPASTPNLDSGNSPPRQGRDQCKQRHKHPPRQGREHSKWRRFGNLERGKTHVAFRVHKFEGGTTHLGKGADIVDRDTFVIPWAGTPTWAGARIT